MTLASSRLASAGLLVLSAALALAPSAAAQTGGAHDGRLQTFDGRVERVTWDADRDVPQFLAGDLGALAPSAAPAFFQDHAAVFGFEPEVTVLDAQTDDLGMTHVRVQQTVGGVPVWGAESALHIDRAGRVYAWGGDVRPGAEGDYAPATLNASAAVAQAARAQGAVTFRPSVPADGLADAIDWSPRAELVVFEHDGAFRLAYHVTVFVDEPAPANVEVFVDAATGRVLDQFNSLHTFDPRASAPTDAPLGIRARTAAPLLDLAPAAAFASGTGASLFGGTVALSTLLYQGTYYLYDTTRGPAYIRTLSGNNGTALPGTYVTDTDNAFPASAAVDAHFGAVATFDYYKTTHGRASYDGADASLTSTVNHQSGYNNAFWNGQQMVYGDGDGRTFGPLVSLDIAAHELTHAVTGASAGLIYRNESGALNEAVSDIMAVMVDRGDFGIGERSYTPGTAGDALRYLDDPTRGDQPDHYADRYTGTGDNGGVHINSGIANKQAYLMIAGGTFRGVAVQAVGRGATEKVWYRALTRYFTASTDFAGARAGTVQAAADLYGAGSAQVTAVTNAWAAVGVGAAATGGGGTGGGAADPEWRYETKTYESRHSYRNNANTTDTYTKAGAQRVAMYFERFETEANYDVVRVKNAQGATQATYTGTKAAFWAVVDGASISANLVSDASVVAYGFRVTRVAYFSDRQLLAAEQDPALGFVPEGLTGDVVALGEKVEELALAVGPNPARSSATVTVSLPQAGAVRVAVYDVLGREVAVAFGGTMEAGRRPVALDTGALPAGSYVVVVDAAGERVTRRITVVR